MKPSRTVIALTLAALIPLGAAVAGEQQYPNEKPGTMNDKSGTMKSPGFDKLDTNRDGRISQAEASVDTTIVFSSADANGDGYLDKTEWKNHEKGSNSPTPQSMPDENTDPSVPPTSQPAPDTETPKQ